MLRWLPISTEIYGFILITQQFNYKTHQKENYLFINITKEQIENSKKTLNYNTDI